jgi:hypothetical protein
LLTATKYAFFRWQCDKGRKFELIGDGPIFQRSNNPKVYWSEIYENDSHSIQWLILDQYRKYVSNKGLLAFKISFKCHTSWTLCPNLQWCYTVWSHDKVISFEFYMYFICSLNKIKNHYIDYASAFMSIGIHLYYKTTQLSYYCSIT